ncbi:MAG: AAA family ATPase [Methanothrix sp.]|nr:AAA family ATPase [Methanothrix sp.]
MIGSLKRIQIKGLNGTRTIDITIKDNTLILVGENGSGKTTILRILFHFLSGNWILLYPIQFQEIIAIIDKEEYKLTREQLDGIFKRITNPDYLRVFPPSIQYHIRNVISHSPPDQVFFELKKLSERYGISFDFIEWESKKTRKINKAQYNEKMDEDIIAAMRKAISAQILYLPTYRRIERELSSILENTTPNDSQQKKELNKQLDTNAGYIELVEFGMKDVERAIVTKLDELKEFARKNLTNLTLQYLGDVVDKKYENIGIDEIAGLPEKTIRSVLDRIDETILKREHKERLFKEINLVRLEKLDTVHNKIISHYFIKLLAFQKSLEMEEKPISDFCALCSEYVANKKLIYDYINFKFLIQTSDESGEIKEIELHDLSSGEKQIVSLFSHLYLSGQKKYFILIDEPELSLSVPWQRRFLIDICKSEFYTGLIAATHSPFIYDNDLLPYAHGLGEFEGI